ncbi:MAG: THUMP domain-containing protein [Desulfurococcales archaeon]|nr:THUMP domain-containing protein [Desulfurococcales archaeon]
MRLLFTCNPGTEDVVSLEAAELLGATPLENRKMYGRIVVETPIEDYELLAEKIYEMRTIHYAGILLLWDESEEPNLDWIKKSAEESFIWRYIPGSSSFAVKSVREGSHDFTSMDISKVVGGIIYDSIKNGGVIPIVRLNSPSILVRADLIENELYISLSLTGDYSRHIRRYRVFDHPAALKSTLAAVMLRLAQAVDGDIILDPMCGSGTVALEATHIFEASRIICNDVNAKHIRSAKANAFLARVKDRIKFTVSNALDLDSKLEEPVDVIVSNPPYGIRLGSARSVKVLYKKLVSKLPFILSPGGRVSFITPEGRYMKRLLVNNGFEIIDYRKVKHGDLWVSIITGQQAV